MDELLSKCIIVAETENMTEAAQRLGISQPALSIAIKTLEKRFGTQLFIRTRTGTKLTAIGQKVYNYAKTQHIYFENLQKEIQESLEYTERELKVGAIDTIGTTFINEIYPKYKSKYNRIHLNLCIDNTKNLTEMTQKGQCEISIITLPHYDVPQDLTIAHIMAEKMELVTTPEKLKEIKNFNDLNKIPFFSYNRTSNTFEGISKKLNELHIKPNIPVHSTSPEIIKQLVLQGQGMSYLPNALVKDELMSRQLVSIPFPELQLERKLAIIYRKDVYMSQMERDLISDIIKHWK